MKKIFTRSLSVVATIILFVGIALPACAQFVKKSYEINNEFYTAVTKDAVGNIYAIRSGDGVHASVIKYAPNSTSFTTLFSGLAAGGGDESNAGFLAWGLAVNSLGDVYCTTNLSTGSTVNGTNVVNGVALTNHGNVIKLATNNGFNGTVYTASVFLNSGLFYTSLAFDASNNLYVVQTDNTSLSHYTVRRYPAGSTSGTELFNDLNDDATDNYPHGLALASNGDIYVCDAGQKSSGGTSGHTGGVRHYVNSSGTYSSHTNVSTGKYPMALALDGSGNLYVSETDGTAYANYRLNKYNASSHVLTAGNITTPLIASGGILPDGISAVNDHDIYVAGGGNPSDFFELIGPATTPASGINFTATAATTTTINWTNGDGASRAVFVAQASSGAPSTANSTNYTANTNFGSGTQAGSGWYCVYNGTGTSVNVTGLTVGTTYRAMVVEYNGTVTLTDENYLTTSNAGNTANVTTISPTTINSLNRVTSQFTNASSVNFLATFGTAVTGVTASNFSVTATGVTGVTNANIGTPTTGDGGITWTVPVTTGTGNGTIQLNLANATGLSKTISTSLPFAGQTYTLYKVTNTNDHFRTKNTTGNWATATDWESSADNSFFITATAAPSGTATDITIQTGHTIAISAAQTASAIAMSGMININSQTLTVSGSITGAGSGKYIKTNGGILKMNVANAATKIFPVGNSAYNPLSITNNTGAADDFSVQVSDEVVGASGHTITQPHIKRTWDIAKTNPNGGSGINLVFNWNSGENSAVINTPALYHFASPLWVKQTGATSSTATSLTYTGYTGTFSPFAIGDAAVPLPLNLLSFTGAMQPSGAALLQWQTARETNTAYFGIDRSFDGKDFTEIGRQDATNNASAISNYSFTDQNTGAQHSSSGRRYYRLKLIDLNGNFTYSNILSIDNYVSSTDDISVFPNPVTDHLSFRVNDWTQVKEITLTDNAGKILTRSTTPVNDLSMGCYPAGIYQLSILKTNGEIISKQVVKGR